MPVGAVTGGAIEKKWLWGSTKYHHLSGQVKSETTLWFSICKLCDLQQGRDIS